MRRHSLWANNALIREALRVAMVPSVTSLFPLPCQGCHGSNHDGAVDGLDIDPFIDVLLDSQFATTADMNGDGAVNGLDVAPFVAVVFGGGAHQIPEPSTLLLVLLALGVFGGWLKCYGN